MIFTYSFMERMIKDFMGCRNLTAMCFSMSLLSKSKPESLLTTGSSGVTPETARKSSRTEKFIQMPGNKPAFIRKTKAPNDRSFHGVLCTEHVTETATRKALTSHLLAQNISSSTCLQHEERHRLYLRFT